MGTHCISERAMCPQKISFLERKAGGRWPFEGSHAKPKTLRTASSLNTNRCMAQLSPPHCVPPCASGPQGLCRVQGTLQEKCHSHAMGLGPSSAWWCDPCLCAGHHSSFPVMQSPIWVHPLLWDLRPWKRSKQKHLA